MKLKRPGYFLSLVALYILIGIIIDCFDIGVKEAIAAVTWKKIVSAALSSLIMTLIFANSPKEKK